MTSWSFGSKSTRTNVGEVRNASGKNKGIPHEGPSFVGRRVLRVALGEDTCSHAAWVIASCFQAWTTGTSCMRIWKYRARRLSTRSASGAQKSENAHDQVSSGTNTSSSCEGCDLVYTPSGLAQLSLELERKAVATDPAKMT